MLYKYKFVRKIIVFLISLIMVLNQCFCNVNAVYADSYAYSPALMPLYTLVASVLVATGVVASNNMTALNNLVNNVISEIKASEVAKATSDDTYNSWYKVINNNNEPEKPDNNNKNGKWFALVGASALGSAVAFEKGAVQDIVDTAKNLGAYNAMQGSIGTFDAIQLKNNTTASAVALQLANVSNSCVTQFDTFLHSDWWDDKDFTPDDCYFFVNVNVEQILRQEPMYPYISIRIVLKNDDLKFVSILQDKLRHYIMSNQYGSKEYDYIDSNANIISFLNNDGVVLPLRYYGVLSNARNADQQMIITTDASNYSITKLALSPIRQNNYTQFAYAGYKWMNQTPWNFTQNVYNTTNVVNQYPNWDLSSIDLLNQNIEALRIGIQDLNNPWENTQNGVQTDPVPEPVISQLINNWLNPENAPDPDPTPDPEPDPEPVPDPTQEPVPDDSYMENFLLPSTITEKFPFSVPFDIVRCLRLFSTSARSAPRWEYDLTYGGQTTHVVLDLSVFDDVASLIRPIEFIGFLVGLAYATRYLIKG